MQSPGSSTQQTTADTESLVKMMEISAGYWLSRALQVVADLGVADAIGQFPRSAADLAATVRADTGALNRVLRLLASEGIFERQNDTYSHNQCVLTGTVSFAAENSNGVFVASSPQVSTTLNPCTSASTLTATWAQTGADPSLLRVTPTTSITPTKFQIVYSAENFSAQAPTY